MFYFQAKKKNKKKKKSPTTNFKLNSEKIKKNCNKASPPKKKKNPTSILNIILQIQSKEKKQGKDVGVANPRILQKKKQNKNPIYTITT